MPNKVEGPGQGSADRPKLSLGNKEKFDEALRAAENKPLPHGSGPPPPPPNPPEKPK